MYSLESTDPRESEIRLVSGCELRTNRGVATPGKWSWITDQLGRGNTWSVVVNYGPDLDYWTFLDSNLHTRLAIVTENELGLAFPPRNLPSQKILSRSVHVLFSYHESSYT